jgi:hypothetical protein
MPHRLSVVVHFPDKVQKKTVEKLTREKFVKVGSRQEALQTIFSALLDVFDLPI